MAKYFLSWMNTEEQERAWFAQLSEYERRGEFPGKCLILIDPDNRRYRNVYEDIEIEQGQRERHCVVSFYPEYGMALENGEDGSSDQEVITHLQAMRDMRKMLAMGWKIASIEDER